MRLKLEADWGLSRVGCVALVVQVYHPHLTVDGRNPAALRKHGKPVLVGNYR